MSGQAPVKEASYSTPQGPKGQDHKGPGLGETNYGNCGSQGDYSITCKTSGSPGIGGTRRQAGSQK